ncbi:MAG: hypothetical protein C5B50_19935 [Verrucomicrobia bacterium]|nr:MAG: hypothetical protein C5B50_19935 [Verrucomicrobiota bacterium]
MSDLDKAADEFDKPWKAAIERFLKHFLQLCFPAVHDLVDWRHPAEFLDTELRQLGPDHEHGGLSVDRLVS